MSIQFKNNDYSYAYVPIQNKNYLCITCKLQSFTAINVKKSHHFIFQNGWQQESSTSWYLRLWQVKIKFLPSLLMNYQMVREKSWRFDPVSCHSYGSHQPSWYVLLHQPHSTYERFIFFNKSQNSKENHAHSHPVIRNFSLQSFDFY